MTPDLSTRVQLAGWTQQALADALEVTQGAVSQWMNKRVPAERVLEFEKLTGIPRHELRPDIYPIEREAQPGEAA